MMSQYIDPATLALEEIRQKSLEKTAQDGTQPQVAPIEPTQSASPTVEAPTNQTPTTTSGWFGAGKGDAMAEAEQNDSDRKSAWDNIKGNKDLPMLGLMFGLNMLANSGTNDLGTALGKAGATTLNAYQTMQKQKADADYKRAHMDLWQQQAAAQKKKAERDAQFEDLKAEAWKRYYNGDRSMDVMATLFPQQYGQYVLNSQLAEDKAALRPVAGSSRSSSGGGRTGGGAPVLGVAPSGRPTVASNGGTAPQTDGNAPEKDSLGGSFGTYYDFSNKSALSGLPSKGTWKFGDPTMVTFPDGSQHWGALDSTGKIFRSMKQVEQPQSDGAPVPKVIPKDYQTTADYILNMDKRVGNILSDLDEYEKHSGERVMADMIGGTGGMNKAVRKAGDVFGMGRQAVDALDPYGVKLRGSLGRLSSKEINALSGAAVSEKEFDRLSASIPTEDDNPFTVRQKLSNFRRELRDIAESRKRQFGYVHPALEPFLGGGKKNESGQVNKSNVPNGKKKASAEDFDPDRR